MAKKVAILGAGNMGKVHAKWFQEEGIEVVAICSRTQESRSDFKQHTNLDVEEYHVFEDMLEQSEFDILCICVPPFAQTTQFERAAARKKHIFIEKPIALDTTIGKRMVNAAKEHGIITQVGFHMRYGEAVTKLNQFFSEGKTGRPVLFQAEYQCNSLHTPWWINVDLCGGQVFEQAIHLYDMARFLIGEPGSVEGKMNNLCHADNKKYTVEDVCASITMCSNGAISSITSNNCGIPGKWTAKFKAVYEKMTVEFQDFNHATFYHTGEIPVKIEEVNGTIDPYHEQIRQFVKCIHEGTDSSCNILEGYKSLAYVESVVNSAKKAR